MDELVKRLRSVKDNWQSEEESWMLQAADAIEELEFACNRYEKDYKDLCAYLPKWIPVTERLPSENGLYFCCWKAQCDDKLWIIRLANWRADTGWMNMYDEPMKEPISHWMPLPQPPTAEEGET